MSGGRGGKEGLVGSWDGRRVGGQAANDSRQMSGLSQYSIYLFCFRPPWPLASLLRSYGGRQTLVPHMAKIPPRSRSHARP